MNIASQHKDKLRGAHYAIQSHTDRNGYNKQYDYQLYPDSLEKLLDKTGINELKIIPIGDSDVDGDYWVIPYTVLKELLIEENLTRGSVKGKRRSRRWRFHIENQLFVLYPGNRVRLGEIEVQGYYGVPITFPDDGFEPK